MEDEEDIEFQVHVTLSISPPLGRERDVIWDEVANYLESHFERGLPAVLDVEKNDWRIIAIDVTAQ